jgi:hypothetical protein
VFEYTKQFQSTSYPKKRSMKKLVGIAIVIIAAFIIFGASIGHSHDFIFVNAAGQEELSNAEWIMTTKYAEKCCGPEDCFMVKSRVEYTATGYKFSAFDKEWTVPFKSDKVIQDPGIAMKQKFQAWACYELTWNDEVIEGSGSPNMGYYKKDAKGRVIPIRIRCLFVKPIGG